MSGTSRSANARDETLRNTGQARQSLNAIARGIVETGGDPIAARLLTERLRSKCRSFAGLPAALGRARPELGLDVRSFAVGNYVLFFRYTDDVFEVIDVVDGRRDIEAYFSED